MSITEITQGLSKNDKPALKHLFDNYYGKLYAMVNRYCKSQTQAAEIFYAAFHSAILQLQLQKNAPIDLGDFLEKEVLKETIERIKSIRSEYYVASTVHASDRDSKNYNLFEANHIIDYSSLDNEIVLKAMQQMVPSQRLIFNLHVIEGYSLEAAAQLLEASEQTAKSNLEKARFNLQKNIEKNLKQLNYE